jgi:multiple sugar transport system substrate-binding protein
MKKAVGIILSIILIIVFTLPAAAVSSVPVKSITLDKSDITLKPGETSTLKITFAPQNTTQRLLTFSTTNKNVATIDSTGKITAVSKGTTTITVLTSNQNISAKCNVTVIQPEMQAGAKTIKFYTWEAVLKDQNKAVIDAFQAKHPDIKVDIEYPVENDNVAYTQKIDLLLLSGEQIDCMMESSVQKMTSKVDRKLYQPLDAFIKKEGVDYDKIYSVSSKIGGSYYALPIDVTTWFVMMNKTMLTKAGLPVPGMNWTWDDYREYARKLTTGEGQNKVYGSYFHTWQNYDLMGVYSTKMDNAYYKKDGSLNFDDPNLKGWLKFRYDMENVDKTSESLMDIKTLKLAYRNEFFGGKVAMVPTGSWMLAEIKDTAKWPHDFQTVFAPLPVWGASGIPGYTFSDTKMVSIPENAKNPDAAYTFIRYYTTEGAHIRAGGLTAERNVSVRKMLPAIVGNNPYALYDINSLLAIFNSPKLVNNAPMYAPPYNAEIDTMFVSECEKYLVGGESLDQCITNLQTQGKDIIKKYK